MRVTTQGEYGLRCMINIGKNCNSGPVSIQSISEEEGLPRTYVEQLLLKLRRSGLIRSVRGAKGGYFLAKESDKITVDEIIRALEGVVFEIVCERRANSRVKCKYKGKCVLNSLWIKLSGVVENLLHGITLQELVETELKNIPN